MATIRKRKDKYQALVRLSNHPTISRTFMLKSDAKNWARETEIKIEKGLLSSGYDKADESLGQILERYLAEISPRKRGHAIFLLSNYHNLILSYNQIPT